MEGALALDGLEVVHFVRRARFVLFRFRRAVGLAWPLSALCCLDVVLLEWVIARVCLCCLQLSIAALAHKKREPGLLAWDA